MTEPQPPTQFDRRAMLRRAAAAGAVAWTAPVVLTADPASAGVFTAKCAPSTVTANATFTQISCTSTNTTIRITISFNGACPCGGVSTWCAQKNTPLPAVLAGSPILVFNVTIPIRQTITIRGKVALGCVDRDGDMQFAVYDWQMTATDSGAACAVANSISAVTLSNRTIVNSAACPPLSSAVAAMTLEAPTLLPMPPQPRDA